MYFCLQCWLLLIVTLSNAKNTISTVNGVCKSETFPEAKQSQFDDSRWKAVTLPHAFNEDEAFKVSIEQLTDTVVWYRKHFRIPASGKKQKVFIEFEGVRQAGDFYLNGQYLGKHENGVMAAGFDLTPYIKEGDNVLGSTYGQ